MNLNLDQQKRLKYLIIVLVIVVIAFLIFFTEKKFIKELPPISREFSRETISIDTSILKNPILEALEPFEYISLPEDLETEMGRENPFISY